MSLPEFGTIVQQSQESEEEVSPQDEIPQFGKIVQAGSPPKKKKEIFYGDRMAGQLLARGFEHIVSGPRELGEFAERLVPKKTITKLAGKVGLGEGADTLIKFTEKYAPYKLFPTHEQLKDFTKDIFGDLLEPRNKAEEIVGETFGEFSSLVFPFMKGVKPLPAALLSAGANAVKQTGEFFGVEEKKANLMKLGTYVVGAFLHPWAAERFYKTNFNLARKNLPQNAKIDSTKLSSTLDTLEKDLTMGGVSSADSPALKQIQNIRNEMQGALTPVESLVAVKKKINIERGNLYKQLEGNKPGIKTAHRNMERVSKAVDDSLEGYAKNNPSWGKPFKEANNAFAAVQSSNKASNFLKGKLPKIAITHVGLSALLGHLGSLKAGGIALAAGAASYPPYLIAKTLNKIMKSPPLRREYLRLYQGAARGNAAEIARSANLLDQGLQKLDE